MDLRDESIVEQVLQGDASAFRVLVDRHGDMVFRFVSNIVGGQDAEDIAQEAFLSAFRALDRFDARRAQFSPWLLTIARNESFSFLRKGKAVTRHVTLSEAKLESDGFEAIGQSDDPTVVAEQTEALQLLHAAIASLPVEQRAAFTLVEVEQLSYDEAIAVEEIPLGTLKSRVNRAKSKLLNVLQKLELRAARRDG